MSDPAYEEVICANCNGSGQGYHETSTCYVCKGRGCVMVPVLPCPACDQIKEGDGLLCAYCAREARVQIEEDRKL